MCQVTCEREQLKNEYMLLPMKNETDLLLLKINAPSLQVEKMAA